MNMKQSAPFPITLELLALEASQNLEHMQKGWMFIYGS